MEGGFVLSTCSISVYDSIPGDVISVGHIVEYLAGEGQAATGGVEVDEAISYVNIRGQAKLENVGMYLGSLGEGEQESGGPKDERERVVVGANSRQEHPAIELDRQALFFLVVERRGARMCADKSVVAE